MYGKMLITCSLVVRTGLHIGGSGIFSPIGAVDSPVIRDPLTRQPIVPGSSLKGKLRTLLVRSDSYSKGDGIVRLPEIDKEPRERKEIRQLFGCAHPVCRSRLQFSDCFVTNAEEMGTVGLTGVKTENAIRRDTSVANPRQIERVNPGVKFGVRIVYYYTLYLQSFELAGQGNEVAAVGLPGGPWFPGQWAGEFPGLPCDKL